MFELAVAAVFTAALIPFLFLLNRIYVLRKQVERALAAVGNSDEQMRSLISVQRDLLGSFEAFDSFLGCVQYSYTVLDTTTRDFVGTFRERAAAYIERGCEGSLLISTHLREDRLKPLALELARRHQADFSLRESRPIKLDALDNGDFSEYLKLFKYLVRGYCSRGEAASDGGEITPRFAHVTLV